MNKELDQIMIDHIVNEGKQKANEKLGFFNTLIQTCLKKGLTSEDVGRVYEEFWRGVMQICESRLRNTIAIKKRYQEEIAKQQQVIPTP